MAVSTVSASSLVRWPMIRFCGERLTVDAQGRWVNLSVYSGIGERSAAGMAAPHHLWTEQHESDDPLHAGLGGQVE